MTVLKLWVEISLLDLKPYICFWLVLKERVERRRCQNKNLISIDVMQNLFQYHHVGLLLHFNSQMLLLFYYLKKQNIIFFVFSFDFLSALCLDQLPITRSTIINYDLSKYMNSRTQKGKSFEEWTAVVE